MKKRSIAIFMVMILSVLLIACGNNVNTAGSNNNEEVANEVEENDAEEVEETEVVEETVTEETVEESDEISLDSSLTGMDLLLSIGEATPPNKLVMTSETSMMGAKTITTSYAEGDKMRSEVDMEGFGKTITISLNDGEEIYTWQEGATEGTKITGMSVEEASELGYMSDDGDLFEEITDESAIDMTARVDVLDGEEVIYVESTETDEDGGQVQVYMWYSVKYATPLKYEMYMGGEEPTVSYLVTDIDKKMNIDNSMFTPPSDINFMEVDMGAMMDMNMDMFDDMD